MNQEYYVFGHNSSYYPRYTYAISIIPKSPEYSKTCPICGSNEKYPSSGFDIVLEGGREFPDILGCGPWPFLIVSNKVIELWRFAGIKEYDLTPLGISWKNSSVHERSVDTQYFKVEIFGRCIIDTQASNIEVESICPRCRRKIIKPSLTIKYCIQDGSWDGNDLFRDVDLFPYVTFCTKKVFDLAVKNKLTNFYFDPLCTPIDLGSKGIKYI